MESHLQIEDIHTCGLSGAEYEWNFEKDPPSGMGEFDLVVSQAILEHLIDPYKHVCDLAGFLALNGHLMIHTVLPGFRYHRYPIDALRFYPDWFEEIAKRLGLTAVKKKIKKQHLFYVYQNEERS